MNYNHAYHAGSFTDVFKHIVLIALLEKLKLKDKAFCYLDTHSAYPYYQLNSVQALKTGEAQEGIQKLLQAKPKSALIQRYLMLIDDFHAPPGRATYPGSPAFAALLKRPQDTLILNELMPEPYQALKHFFRQDASVHCHQQDAYQILNALLPPKEKRGLILIDPPYEDPQEFDVLVKKLQMITTKFPQGIYAIWYPIKDQVRVSAFIANMQKKVSQEQLNLTCCPWGNDVSQRLSGSGMLIINPPWKLEEELAPVIRELNAIFKC